MNRQYSHVSIAVLLETIKLAIEIIFEKSIYQELGLVWVGLVLGWISFCFFEIPESFNTNQYFTLITITCTQKVVSTYN